MHTRISLLLTVMLGFAAATLTAQPPYRNYDELTRQLQTLQKKYDNIMTLNSIGLSAEGRKIWAVTLSKGNDKDKPAIAIIANIEASRLAGSVMATHLISGLCEKYNTQDDMKKLFTDQIIYIIPRLNVDGAESYFNKIKEEKITNNTAIDNDHDGLLDEDGADDLNSDKLITMMRCKEAGGEWMIDPEHPELLKKADILKGETGIYALYPEGIDDDNDGLYNEDGKGGVNLNNNFPHAYPYHQKNAGVYMTSEPETRAMLDFFMAHKNITLMLTYSKYDNLRHIPTPASKKPKKGYNRSLVKKMDKDDLEYHKILADLFTKGLPSEYKKCSNPAVKPQGALHSWAYYQYGILGLSTNAWTRPQPVDSSDTKGSKRKADDESTWLEWFKHSDINGHIKWTPFKHPQLGDVEIGGFVPFTKITPPSLGSDLIDSHVEFALQLAKKLPHVKISGAKAINKSNGIYDIELTVQNTGFLPTLLEHAQYTDAVMPTRAKIEKGNFTLLAGKVITFIDPLKHSEAQTLHWTIQAKKTNKITISVWSEKAGTAQQTLTLN